MHEFRQTVLKWPKNCATAIECQMQLVALRREQEEKEAEDKINEEKQWEMVNKADRIMSQVLKATQAYKDKQDATAKTVQTLTQGLSMHTEKIKQNELELKKAQASTTTEIKKNYKELISIQSQVSGLEQELLELK